MMFTWISLFVSATAMASNLIGDPIKASASQEFSWRVFKKAKKEGENNVFSPHSLRLALGLTFAGAKGETSHEIFRVLGGPSEGIVSLGKEERILSEIEKKHKKDGFQWSSANRIWAQKNLPLAQGLIRDLRSKLSADLSLVDFLATPDASRIAINKWVESVTRDKIKDLLGPNQVTRETIMVLANAVYFYSSWKTPFPVKDTKKESFQGLNRKTEVSMMNLKQTFQYGETSDGQVARIPYAAEGIDFVVFLPKTIESFKRWSKELSGDHWNRLTRPEVLNHREVLLSLPKFKLEAKLDLKKPLQNLGMPRAFSDQADFSGFFPAKEPIRAKVSDVVQKVFIDLSEKGTEAAAATAVGMVATSFRPPEEPVVLRVDRPFFFSVEERSTGLVLFAGEYVQP